MGKAMFSPDVVGTDEFIDLPEDAQLTYFRLGFEGTYGKIVGVRRIVRGYGTNADALRVLYESGYLFDYNGACWVRHFWENNTFKSPNNDHAKTMPEIKSGEIGFVGEPFKSAFICPSVDKPSISLSQGSTYTDSSTGTDSVAGEGSGSVALTATSADAGEGARGEGEDLHHCLCTRCGAKVPYVTENQRTMIHCPTCGTYEFSYESDSEGYSVWDE